VLVITDADAALDPSCIRELVRVLLEDAITGIVGARVRPATRLLEERVHWWMLNSLWWIEGDGLGTAVVSGVCYAVRRRAVSTLPVDCTAEDIHFALAANARGWNVRLARSAWATELRVPQTVAEFLRFRRRRGFGYARELRRVHPPGASLRWHVSRLLRLAHFFVTPLLAAVVAASGAALCLMGNWQAPAEIAAAFFLPAVAALAVSTTLGGSRRRWWRLGLAAGRLAGLTWLALLILPRAGRTPSVQEE
jgi:cellulose synthase/poly-beta-1,6-N-acetylglucosamine synthase-like glycosyltransferase